MSSQTDGTQAGVLKGVLKGVLAKGSTSQSECVTYYYKEPPPEDFESDSITLPRMKFWN